MPGFAVPITLQAPCLPYGPFQAGFTPASYPEILLDAGFGNPATLGMLVHAWQAIFRLGEIDALVADFSPTAVLAARLARIPVLHLGDGFTIPPTDVASRSGNQGQNGAEDRLRVAISRLLACVNQVEEAAGAALSDSVASLCAARETVLATYPEIDHCRGRARQVAYAGHFENSDQNDNGWRPVPGPRILAYLKPTAPEFEATVEVLRRLPAQTRLYASGLVRPSDSSTGFGVTWSAEPIAFPRAVRGADMVISNAGHGATCATLLAGKPLCMLPTVYEQLLTARNVETLGAGETLLQVRDPKRIRRAISRGLEAPEMAKAAQEFASRHAVQAASAAVRLAEIADRFLGLVKRGQAT
jgi:UDP:flavonoid glycosyltransferase YjiC (YdhE family)